MAHVDRNRVSVRPSFPFQTRNEHRQKRKRYVTINFLSRFDKFEEGWVTVYLQFCGKLQLTKTELKMYVRVRLLSLSQVRGNNCFSSRVVGTIGMP